MTAGKLTPTHEAPYRGLRVLDSEHRRRCTDKSAAANEQHLERDTAQRADEIEPG